MNATLITLMAVLAAAPAMGQIDSIALERIRDYQGCVWAPWALRHRITRRC
jgi:hypothetical protein